MIDLIAALAGAALLLWGFYQIGWCGASEDSGRTMWTRYW